MSGPRAEKNRARPVGYFRPRQGGLPLVRCPLSDQPEHGSMNGFDYYRDPLGAYEAGDDLRGHPTRAGVAGKPGPQLPGQPKTLETLATTSGIARSEGQRCRAANRCASDRRRGLPRERTGTRLAEHALRRNPSEEHLPLSGTLPHPRAGGGLGGASLSAGCRSRYFLVWSGTTSSSICPSSFLARISAGDVFVQTRPELGDVSRGEVEPINNYYRLFKEILTQVQLDGLRLLVTPFPQEEFNPTDDRKIGRADFGRDLLLIATLMATPAGQFHINPDTRPEQRISVSTRSACAALFSQHIHGSKAQSVPGRGFYRT